MCRAVPLAVDAIDEWRVSVVDGKNKMATQRRIGRTRRVPWGTLVVAVACFAIAIALLLYVPSPINITHVTESTTPGSVVLPPTAVPYTPVSPTVTPAP